MLNNNAQHIRNTAKKQELIQTSVRHSPTYNVLANRGSASAYWTNLTVLLRNIMQFKYAYNSR